MSRPSYLQIEKLIDFMERNPSIAKGFMRTNEARHNTKLKWAELASELNCLEGACKDAKGWAKVWTDKKYYLKKAVAKRNSSARRTGGGVEPLLPLTDMEERILHVLGGPGFALGNREVTVPLSVPIEPEEPLRPVEEEVLAENPTAQATQEEVVVPLSYSPRRSPRRQSRRMQQTQLNNERERLIRIEEKRVEAELKNAAGWESVAAGWESLAGGLNRLATAITVAGERNENGLGVLANAIKEAVSRNPQYP